MEAYAEKDLQFHEMGLDNRLLKAIAKLGWATPTAVQERAIPLALDGNDILSRARTGSGKTAAYVIPIVQTILNLKKMANQGQHTLALILVPSRELSAQAQVMINELVSFCSRSVHSVDISHEANPDLLRPLLAVKPDIIVGTPSRVLAQMKAGYVSFSKLRWLVLDEADLLFSFGYEDDLRSVYSQLPSGCQAFITSATFTEDVKVLKKLVLHNPVMLNLNESRLPSTDKLTQYHVFSESEDDKYLLIYALLKLKLIRGKSLLFVNSVSRSYRLKLFLEQFSIFCCILNSEMPVSSRCHVVEQYNQGLYDNIIATDESSVLDLTVKKALNDEKKKSGKHGKKRKAKVKEYGVSRGIDFQNVSNVINFDFPTSVEAYIHRVGRTARGDQKGTALSFVLPNEMAMLESAQKELSGSEDSESPLKPYQFRMAEIEGFRYRCKDAVRAVTKTAIREARIKEVRREMLNSEKLKTYFEENPKDLQVLRHDAISRPLKVKKHMKNVPEYLIPPTLKGMYTGAKATTKRPAAPPSHAAKKKTSGAAQRRQKMGQPNPKYKKNREDPLKSFKYIKK